MTTYVVGDLQGCLSELQALLSLVDFDAHTDQLWLTGDLVNRGPMSLGCLRFIRSLGDAAVAVLGNHDIHLLAVYYADQPGNHDDTLDELLAAPDCHSLMEWLRFRPLIHRRGDDLMVHAGIPHIWTIEQAEQLAREVEAALRGDRFRHLLRVIYGDCPRLWRHPDGRDGAWSGVPRLRAIVNYLVRMRVINRVGRCDFDDKQYVANRARADADSGGEDACQPWFDFWPRSRVRIFFGHWAALGANSGRDDIIALDAGCAWGHRLLAMRLEDGALFSVPAERRVRPTTSECPA